MTDLEMVAVVFCRESKFGVEDDPQLGINDIVTKTGLVRPAVINACRQLAERRLIKIRFPFGAPQDFDSATYAAMPAIFQRFDKQAIGTDPQGDAQTLVEAIPNIRGQALNVYDFIRDNGWTIRRVNPSIEIVLALGAFGSTERYVGDGLVNASLFRRGNF